MTLRGVYTFIDFETDGKCLPNSNKMDEANQTPVEVCVVRVVGGEVTSLFNTLMHYNGPWTDVLKNGHHSQEDLLKGMPQNYTAEVLYAMLQNPGTVVAYNALFDVRVTQNLFDNWRLDTDVAPWSDNINILCPLTIARERHGAPHKLVDMLRKYGITIEAAHTAHDDTLALVELVEKMHQEEDVERWVNKIGWKRQYGEPSWKPERVELFPQGNETVYHKADGTTAKQTNVGRPFQRVVMGKPVASEAVADAVAEMKGVHEALQEEQERSADGIAYDLVMGLRNGMSLRKAEQQPVEIGKDTPLSEVVKPAAQPPAQPRRRPAPGATPGK